MLIGTEANFNGSVGSWYVDPYKAEGEAHYRDYPVFSQRATNIKGRFNTGKILIAGCGYGYLVKHLLSLGADAWGVDASPWAISQGTTVAPNRILQADVTQRAQLDAARTAAGLKSTQKFTAVITEELLPSLTDAEVAVALTELRRVGTVLFHIVTAVELQADRMPEFNWKTLAEWKTVVGTELVMGVESGTIL